jgi:hypothetical protein
MRTLEELVIFIDANCFLLLYEIARAEKLLDLMEACGDALLVTQQVADEVTRNKVVVAGRFLKAVAARMCSPNADIPDVLFGLSANERAALQERVQGLRTGTTEVQTILAAKASAALKSVVLSEDPISVRLAPIFDASVSATDEEMKFARVRRELGRAPGKPSCPLGDQINWEQILSRLENHGELWIVSKDGDYVLEQFGDCHLNASLAHDILATGKNVQVRVYCNLLDALTEYNSAHPVPTTLPPSEEEATEIKEELAMAGGMWPSPPQECQNCRARGSFRGGAAVKSRLGGLTWQFVCGNCGYYYDTGDFID